MIDYCDIIKQSRAYKILEQESTQNRLAHSYMVISEDNITLNSFISVMLQVIYCKSHNACGECLECIRLEHNNNPNVYLLDKEGTIKVDDIKELISDTCISAVENNYKVYVIKHAENMNEAAQNKLLKTLEEPNQGVIIILSVSSESAMLQTIKSRVKKIYLNVWDNQNIAKELTKIDTNFQNIDLAVKFSKGNLTKAKSLLSDDKFKNCYLLMNKLLTEYSGTAVMAQYLNYLGGTKDEIAYSLSILEGIISGSINDIVAKVDTPLTSSYSIATLANIADLIVETNKRLNSNCNTQAVCSNFLLKLAEIKYLTN